MESFILVSVAAILLFLPVPDAMELSPELPAPNLIILEADWSNTVP